MPRYDVKVEMKMVHTLAIEADTWTEVLVKAWEQVGNREPEKVENQVHIERGVQ